MKNRHAIKKFRSISTKIHIPLILSLAVGLLLVLVTSYSGLDNIKKNVYEKEAKSIKNYINLAMSEKKAVAVANAINISNNKVFIDSLKNNDKQKALKWSTKIVEDYKKYTKFKNVKIHLHTSNVHSFLRSWKPDKNGDDLSSFRHTILEVKKTRSAFSAIEIGRVGVTIRGLAPIMDNNEYIGSIEFLQGFGSIIKDAKQEIDSSVLILLENKYLKIAKSIANNPKIDGFTIAQKVTSIDTRLVDELKLAGNINQMDEKMTDNYFVKLFPLKDFRGKEIGKIVVSKNSAVVNSAIKAATDTNLKQLIIMLITDVFVLIMLIYIVNKLVKIPLQNLIDVTNDLARGNADLTKRLNIHTKDELEIIGNNFNQFIEKLYEILSKINISSNNSAELSNKVQEIGNSLSTVASKQKDGVAKSQEITKKMGQDLDVSESLSIATATDVQASYKTLEAMVNSLNNTVDKISHISEEEQEISENVDRLSEQSNQINSVLHIIRDIADQTNLLALNAAIEAARAAEHGRGFAVVADEVRKLAERTQKSITEIDMTISILIQTVADVTTRISNNSNEMQLMKDNSTNLIELANDAKAKTITTIEQSQQASAEAVFIAQNVKTLLVQMESTMKLSEQNSKIAIDVLDDSNQLNTISKTLKSELNLFKM